MEIMYTEKNNELFIKDKFTAIYKDKIDLINYGIEFDGIDYDDEWTVKRFLNGYKFKIDNRILEIFKELEINPIILNRKIKNLGSGIFKLVLLVYMILNPKNILVLDYFDKGLSYKYKKLIINYLKRNYNKTLIVISNDLVFLNSLCERLIVFDKDKIVFNDEFNKIYKSNIKIEYPEIIKFIRLANKRKAKLSYTVDNKELLKDIYRSIK